MRSEAAASRLRRILRWTPFLVPALFAAAILSLQPAGHFVAAVEDTPGYFLPEGYSRLLFDDSDGIAWMIRAENARRGRLAGRLDADGKPFQPAPAKNHDDYEERLLERPPFADRYFLEYPPLALAFFRFCYLASGSDGRADVAAMLLDEHEFNFACHLPADDAERKFYRGVRRGIDAAAILLLAALAGVMLLVRRGIGRDGIASGSPWLCVLPAMLYFSACRFDILPAGLVLLSVACTARGRPNLGAIALGLAIAFKLYPLVVAPLILRYAFQSWGRAFAWAACCALPSALGNAVLALTDGWPAVLVPFRFQFGREVEPLFILYDRLLPLEYATSPHASLFRNGSVLALVAVLCWRKPADVESLLRRCTLAVMLFVALQVFHSPQWWLWIAVLLVPLARTHRGLAVLIVLADLVTYATFPLGWDRIIGHEVADNGLTRLSHSILPAQWQPWVDRIVKGDLGDDGLTRLSDNLTKARGFLWLGIAALLAYREVRGRRPEPVPPADVSK